MSPHLQSEPRSLEVYVASLARTRETVQMADEIYLLAPAATTQERPPSLWQRIDWTAVGAGAFVYAVAFAVWLFLAR